MITSQQLKTVWKLLLVPLITGALLVKCHPGDPQTTLEVCNDRAAQISYEVKHPWTPYLSEGSIKASACDVVSGASGITNKPSNFIEYLIIQDENGATLHDLRDANLDNSISVISQDKNQSKLRLRVI